MPPETTTSQNYITSDELKATLNIQGLTYADADIAGAITSASRAIDELCNRFFYQDTETTTRIYTPKHYQRLDIHDLVSLTSLATDVNGQFTYTQILTFNVDFNLQPINAPLDAQGWPYTYIKILPVSAQYVFDPTLDDSVQVEGIFGWPAVPQPIQTATTMIATRLLKQMREAPFGIANFDGMGMRLSQLDPTVKMLVGPYMRHRIAIG
jgi:hypothetical protein